jgi:hypothetical protein
VPHWQQVIDRLPSRTITRASPPRPQSVLGIILGGGAGSRLYPLTKMRAKPAVPLGAQYRLIDIPVSNCINSGVTKIYCLTQFNSASLNRHMSQAYVQVGGSVVAPLCMWAASLPGRRRCSRRRRPPRPAAAPAAGEPAWRRQALVMVPVEAGRGDLPARAAPTVAVGPPCLARPKRRFCIQPRLYQTQPSRQPDGLTAAAAMLHLLLFRPPARAAPRATARPPHPPTPLPLQGGGLTKKGFVEVLAASQSTANKNWFQGTADAVRQYMWLFDEAIREGCEDFLILSGAPPPLLGAPPRGRCWRRRAAKRASPLTAAGRQCLRRCRRAADGGVVLFLLAGLHQPLAAWLAGCRTRRCPFLWAGWAGWPPGQAGAGLQ